MAGLLGYLDDPLAVVQNLLDVVPTVSVDLLGEQFRPAPDDGHLVADVVADDAVENFPLDVAGFKRRLLVLDAALCLQDGLCVGHVPAEFGEQLPFVEAEGVGPFGVHCQDAVEAVVVEDGEGADGVKPLLCRPVVPRRPRCDVVEVRDDRRFPSLAGLDGRRRCRPFRVGFETQVERVHVAPAPTHLGGRHQFVALLVVAGYPRELVGGGVGDDVTDGGVQFRDAGRPTDCLCRLPNRLEDAVALVESLGVEVTGGHVPEDGRDQVGLALRRDGGHPGLEGPCGVLAPDDVLLGLEALALDGACNLALNLLGGVTVETLRQRVPHDGRRVRPHQQVHRRPRERAHDGPVGVEDEPGVGKHVLERVQETPIGSIHNDCLFTIRD